MAKSLHIRDFPDELHHQLKIKAAIEKTSIRGLVISYCEEGLQKDKKTTKTKKGG